MNSIEIVSQSKKSLYTIISLEGNIGSGKSTLIDYLHSHYTNNNKIVFLQEPVEDWEQIQDKNGINMIEKFYKNQKKYSFSFQIMAFISRLALLKKTIEEFPSAIIITERSLNTDRHVFAQMLYDEDMLEEVEFQIYLKWFDSFIAECKLDKIIYINSSPSVCFERVIYRERAGENTISLEYLTKCNSYHDKMIEQFDQTMVLILNGNMCLFEKPDLLQKWTSQIETFII